MPSTLLMRARAYSPNSVPLTNPAYTNQSSSPFGPDTEPSRDMTLETITLRMVRLSHAEQNQLLGEILIGILRLLAHDETTRPGLAPGAIRSSHSTICSYCHPRTPSQKQGSPGS